MKKLIPCPTCRACGYEMGPSACPGCAGEVLRASAPDLLAALDKIAAVAHGPLASGFTDKAARLAVLSIAADAIARATGAAS